MATNNRTACLLPGVLILLLCCDVIGNCTVYVWRMLWWRKHYPKKNPWFSIWQYWSSFDHNPYM